MNISRVAIAVAIVFTCTNTGAAAASPQPLEHFARRPQMHGVTLSPDGRYVAFLSGTEDDTVLMTLDRTELGGSFRRVTASEPNKFDIGWCRFANDKRLLCGLYGNLRGKRYAEPPFTRMFGVDANGSALKALEQSPNEANLFVAKTSMRNLNMNQGAHIEKSTASEYAKMDANVTLNNSTMDNYMSSYSPERQDEVIDFTPGDDDTVLIQLDDDRDTYSTLFALNIYTGHRGVRMEEKPPIRSYVTDGRGNPRIGWGNQGVDTLYYARLDGDREWRPLNSFNSSSRLRPIAMAPGENSAYAVGTYEGRDALWTIDLADKRPPELLFKHPLVDVGEPILGMDRRLLGVRYDVERPFVWYGDPKLKAALERLESQFMGRVLHIIDSSADMNTLLIHASSDVDLGTYYIFEVDKTKLQKLGTAYPELNQKTLGSMSNILYKAKDGTEIPGYLTVPTGAEKKNLPLVVMPHDGPTQRDSWKFSYLRTFLADRGYAVLQMNYRGSSGFGEKWRADGQQDWGGIVYSDIHDATRWAISEGIADPDRICIMGTGFGGYAALLGALRNKDTYRCAISVNGITDLEMYVQHGSIAGDEKVRRAMVGADRGKLEKDSPLQNARNIDIPVLLVHGTKDWQVQEDHTKALANALEKHRKEFEEVLIKNAGHDLERKSDRMTLLKEVEQFLTLYLGRT